MGAPLVYSVLRSLDTRHDELLGCHASCTTRANCAQTRHQEQQVYLAVVVARVDSCIALFEGYVQRTISAPELDAKLTEIFHELTSLRPTFCHCCSTVLIMYTQAVGTVESAAVCFHSLRDVIPTYCPTSDAI